MIKWRFDLAKATAKHLAHHYALKLGLTALLYFNAKTLNYSSVHGLGPLIFVIASCVLTPILLLLVIERIGKKFKDLYLAAAIFISFYVPMTVGGIDRALTITISGALVALIAVRWIVHERR